MDYVPPSSGRAPTPLDSDDRPVQPPRSGLAGISQVIPLASQGSKGDADRLDLSPRVQSSLRLCNQVSVLSEERLACSATLGHYIKISSVKEPPPETTDGLRSTFFPVPKKGTNKMRGCIDVRWPNQHI